MTYPGNPALAADVRQRVVETFEHTLGVAEKGNLEEARLGCDFILRLDPLFSPAQRLAERLAGATGPLDVSDFRRGDEDTEDLALGDETNPALELSSLPDAPFGAELPVAASSTGELGQELATLLAERRFDELMTRAQGASEEISGDPELQRLMGEAQERMEASFYAQSFLEQARQALAAGHEEEARSFLEKARSLDAEHPDVALVEASLGGAREATESVSFEELEVMAPEAGVEVPLVPEEPMQVEELSLSDLGDGLPSPDADLAVDDLPDLDELPAAPEAAAQEGPSDPDPRIAELLDEGQAAFQRGDLQPAIDAWSRIFLIDIDHREAARRIEQARHLKAEEERRVDEAYHEAEEKARAGDLEGAKAGFAAVLEMEPGHRDALDYLERIEQGRLEPEADLAAGMAPEELAEGEESADAAQRPSRARERPAPVAAPVKKGAERGRTFWMIAGGVLLLVLAAGAFVWLRWGSLFPNTEETPLPTVATAPEVTPIERATQLHAEGKGAVAIAQLKRVPPASPYHAEAQKLVAQWEAELAQPDAPDAAALERRGTLVALARQAHAERRYLDALPLLGQAGEIAELEGADEELLRDTTRQLEPLRGQLELLRQGEYQRALRDLWLAREDDPSHPVIHQLLTSTYYNLGVQALQQGRPDEAREMLREAAQLEPEDEEIRRMASLAETYSSRPPDLLYRIYTKYLAPRPI